MQSFPFIIRIQFYIMVVLVLAFLAFSGSVIFQRIRKNNLGFLSFQIKKRYDDILSNLIFDDEFEEKYLSAAGKEHLRQIFLSGKNSRLHKNLLIDVIIKLYNNLSGDFSRRVTDIYLALELDKHSMGKLDDEAWEVKVQGIKELSQMKIASSIVKITRYINNSNPILRREARIAFIQLDPANFSLFIRNINSPISYWEIINIIDIINSSKKTYLEHFTPVLKSEQETLIYFCLKVINFFKLVQYSDSFDHLLYHKNPELRKLAINTTGMLASYSKTGLLKDRFREETELLQVEILKTFALIGDTHDIPFLLDILIYSASNKVRLEAVRAINATGSEGREMLLRIRNEDRKDNVVVARMIDHALDTRII
jgi:hypothetical protein